MRAKFTQAADYAWLTWVLGAGLLLLAGCASSPSDDTMDKAKPPANYQENLPIYNDPQIDEPLPIYDRTMQDKQTPPPEPSTNVGG